MADLTPEQLASRVVDLGLATMHEVEAARAELGTGEITTPALIKALHGKKLLTTLQLEKIKRGDRTGFYFGDYKVLYLIGTGTFARVYRAAHRDTDEVVAIKVLRKRYRDDTAQLEQFLREGRVGLSLRHPNIVQIQEVDDNVMNPFLVMEFVEGDTLRELLRIRGKLAADVALRLTSDIASGLAYAASQGVAHRDLKMTNILISSDGKAKLVDFGLAAIADRDNPEKVADSPNARAIDYAALERGTHVRKDDPRSDIYFTGALLYQMLCGKPALEESRDRIQRLNITRFHEAKPLGQVDSTIPLPAIQLVARAMEVDPEKRIQTAEMLQQEAKGTLLKIEEINSGGGGDGKGKGEQTEAPTDEGAGRIVMLVESKAEIMDMVRSGLKKRGYRVLVIADPSRALSRFDPSEDVPADCVIFSATELGSFALEAFNRFAIDDHTQEIPSILLAETSQQKLIKRAKLGEHRVLVPLPLKISELRRQLIVLLKDQPKRDEFF